MKQKLATLALEVIILYRRLSGTVHFHRTIIWLLGHTL